MPCTHGHRQRKQELPRPSTSARAAATGRREQRGCRLPALHGLVYRLTATRAAPDTRADGLPDNVVSAAQLHLSGQTPGNSSLRGRQLLPVGLAHGSGSAGGRDAEPQATVQETSASAALPHHTCVVLIPALGQNAFQVLVSASFQLRLGKGRGREQTPMPSGCFSPFASARQAAALRRAPGAPGLARPVSTNAPYLAAPSSSELFILSDSQPITNKIFDVTNVPLALREGATEPKAAN